MNFLGDELVIPMCSAMETSCAHVTISIFPTPDEDMGPIPITCSKPEPELRTRAKEILAIFYDALPVFLILFIITMLVDIPSSIPRGQYILGTLVVRTACQKVAEVAKQLDMSLRGIRRLSESCSTLRRKQDQRSPANRKGSWNWLGLSPGSRAKSLRAKCWV